MQAESGWAPTPGGSALKAGMTFASNGDTPGRAEVLSEVRPDGPWNVRFPDGAIRPLRPSTILNAPDLR